jgi:hypothetical protein
MSCVFLNIDPPPLSARRVCNPRLCGGGRTHSPGGEGGEGSIFWKTQDTALYSTYIEFSLGRGILSYVLILAGKDLAMTELTEVCSENENRIFHYFVIAE